MAQAYPVAVLGYEGLGCLAGETLLTIAPDGRLMEMPVDIMHGTFIDFLIPGIILFVLGILTSIAFFAVLRSWKMDWLMAGLSMGGLTIWFWVEIAILLELHWLHAMWGLPVLFGGLASLTLYTRQGLLRSALLCGILASLLYVIINILVPAQWPVYNSMTQTVSELSAVGAPTRMLWVVLSTPYTLLSFAFALGVLNVAGDSRPLHIAGILLAVYAALGILWPFAPMHLREALASGGSTFSDTMHLSLGIVTELIYLAALGLTAVAMDRAFRLYSAATFVLLLLFGVLTFLEAPDIGRNQPTPYIGLWERINIGLYLLWVVVLSVTLLRKTLQSQARIA